MGDSRNPRVLLTGMTGTGKSTVLAELARRGHRVVDTDYGGYAEEVPSGDGFGQEQLWREDRITALLATEGPLVLSGCVANQGKFYDRFDSVVLLSAPAEVLLDRIAHRTTNPFGKTDIERDRILNDLRNVEPRLRATATVEISTDRPLDDVVSAVEAAVRDH